MIYPTFDTLMRAIESEVEGVLKESVSKSTEQSLKRSLETNVYARQSSGEFRTGSLRRSVFSEVLKDDEKDDLVLSTYNNPEKMDNMYPSLGANGSPDNRGYNIINWINGGHGGIWDYEPTYFIREARNDVNKNIVRWFSIGLRNKGINYTVR